MDNDKVSQALEMFNERLYEIEENIEIIAKILMLDEHPSKEVYEFSKHYTSTLSKDIDLFCKKSDRKREINDYLERTLRFFREF